MRPFDPAAWYSLAEPDEPVLQGAQFFDVTLRRVIPYPSYPGQYAIGQETADVVVATQSCDLEQRKTAEIEVIPVYPLVEWLAEEPAFVNQLETVRRGHVPSLYILPAWPQARFAQARRTRIVAFDEKRSISWDDLDTLRQKQWLGLRSPYIEHFGQALARFYMRVGLPEDMPPIGWKPGADAPAPTTEKLAPTDPRFGEAGLSSPPRPIEVSSQRLQMTSGPDVLYRASLKQDGTSIGIGRSSDEAISSLLRQLAAKATKAPNSSA
jgi:hypothetical protein